jgi:hypothetical protein
MIDTLVANLDQAQRSSVSEIFGLKPRGFAYIALHGRYDVDDRGSLTGIVYGHIA